MTTLQPLMIINLKNHHLVKLTKQVLQTECKRWLATTLSTGSIARSSKQQTTRITTLVISLEKLKHSDYSKKEARISKDQTSTLDMMMSISTWTSLRENLNTYRLVLHSEVKKQKKLLFNFERQTLSSDKIKLTMSPKTRSSSMLLLEQTRPKLSKKTSKWQTR